MAKISRTLILVAALFPLCNPLQGQEARRQEEQTDYFKKWLQEDVVYIISPEEKAVFQSLTTEQEKEQFIEQFWYRRDPDPRSAVNEFKEEHYRRIAYANERFQSGIPGWRTDRGRVYIAQGPPDEIVAYPSGGPYLRQSHEGGGQTAAYPFEVWRYRHLEGIGEDVELEFVDRTWAGEYRLTTDPDEKDALLRVPNAGPTLAEQLGRASRAQRPFFSPGNLRHYPFRRQRIKDSPFARYETVAKAQGPPALKYPDLKQIVQVNISFSDLPTRLRIDYFQLNPRQDLVPITLEIDNQELTFRDNGGVFVAHVVVYGVVQDINKRVISEFEDDLAVSFEARDFEKGRTSRSTYQKIVTLERGVPHRLDLVVKDQESGKTAAIKRGLAPPAFSESELAISSVVLSDLIVPGRSGEDMFVLGDVKVRPNARNRFVEGNPLGLYLQLYNIGIDQATGGPQMETHYRIQHGEETIIELSGETGEGLALYNDQRAVLVKTVPTERLVPGEYRLEVEIHDRIRGDTVRAGEKFEISPSSSRLPAKDAG